nr:MAG TPA: hypothetical protein [Caudoviricetes sp.]
MKPFPQPPTHFATIQTESSPPSYSLLSIPLFFFLLIYQLQLLI